MHNVMAPCSAVQAAYCFLRAGWSKRAVNPHGRPIALDFNVFTDQRGDA